MERKLIEYAGPVADALDAGLVPWEMPRLPRNVLTGKVYRGMNPMLLQIAACRFGFSSPLWGSRKDWETVGSKLTEPVTAGTRVGIYENLVYYPWDRTDEDVAYNWEQTDRSFQPPVLTLENASDTFARIVEKVGAHLPGGTVGQTGPGSMADYAGLARALMEWGERRIRTVGGYIYNSTSLLRALRADMSAGLLLGLLGAESLPPHLEGRSTVDPRWAELIRKKPEVLPELCGRVIDTLDLLLRQVGVKIPWHFFKVTVTRWCLPRGTARPSVYWVGADGRVLGEVWSEAGGPWKAGTWGGNYTPSRTLGTFKTKQDALTALLAEKGIDKGTPIIDDSNVVSVPVCFGAWAGKRWFDFDRAYYLGDDEDGVYFLPEKGLDGKWYVFVIVSTSWGDSVKAIDGPHDGYVDACEAGLRTALDWCIAGGSRPGNAEVEAIREAARCHREG